LTFGNPFEIEKLREHFLGILLFMNLNIFFLLNNSEILWLFGGEIKPIKLFIKPSKKLLLIPLLIRKPS